MNFQLFKLILQKAEEPRDQIANIRWIIAKVARGWGAVVKWRKGSPPALRWGKHIDT